MKCRICGQDLKDNAKFCENCGAKVEIESTPNETFERVDGEVVSEHHFRQNNEGQNEYTTETGSSNSSYSGASNQSYSGSYQSQNTGSYSSSETQSTTRSYANTSSKPANDKDKYFAIGSLVCGILSIICCCCCIPFVNFIFGGAAVGLGIYVLTQNLPGKEMAIAGIVCGGVGLFIFLAGIIANVSGFASDLTNGFDINDIEEFIEDL